jgi:hypothetical protein
MHCRSRRGRDEAAVRAERDCRDRAVAGIERPRLIDGA